MGKTGHVGGSGWRWGMLGILEHFEGRPMFTKAWKAQMDPHDTSAFQKSLSFLPVSKEGEASSRIGKVGMLLGYFASTYLVGSRS